MNIQDITLINSYHAFIKRAVELDIKSFSSKWVEESPLWQVCLIFLLCEYTDSKLANPTTLARLVTRLKKHEVQTGGPYTDNGSLDLMTNIFIYQIMCIYKIDLPNVKNYLVNQISELNSKPTENISQQWFFSWSKSITKTKDDAQIEARSEDYFPGINKSLATKAQTMLNKIYSNDKSGEIRHFSSILYNSLRNNNRDITPTILDELDRANLYAWLAYVIYDDILDEHKTINLLPLANIAQRKSFELYLRVCGEYRITTKLVKDIFDAVDTSLDLEQTMKISNTKSPPIDDLFLSSKSIGHLLGPLLILRILSFEDSTIKAMDAALKDYLIARQLCDDLKDFEEDMKAGLVTYPIQKIMDELHEDNTHNFTDARLIKAIRDIYWDHVLEDTVRYALSKINQSISALKTICMVDSELHHNIMQPIKNSLENILKNHMEKKEFLKAYMDAQSNPS